MSCEWYREQLLTYPENGQRPPSLKHHLTQCPGCKTFDQRLQRATQAFRAHPPADLDPAFTQEVMGRVSRSATAGRTLSYGTLMAFCFLLVAVAIGLFTQIPSTPDRTKLSDAQRAAIADELQTTQFRPLAGIDCGLPGGHCRFANAPADGVDG